MEKYNEPKMEVVKFDDKAAIMMFGEDGDTRGCMPINLPCHNQSGNQDASYTCSPNN